MPKRFHNFQPGDRKPKDEEEEDAPVAVPDDIQKPAGIENRLSPPFSTLAGMFANIEKGMRKRKGGHASKTTKNEHIKTFIQSWREHVGPDLYPALRLMLPERDNRRRTYNLKEAKLAKAYVSALDLPTHSSAALKLEQWKVPTKEDPAAGEFSIVAYDVIYSRSSVERGTFTVADVNDILDRLSRVQATSAASVPKRAPNAIVASIIKECVLSMTAEEQKWLIRIILRDLKIGLGEKQVFNAFHPNAMQLFNTCSDILRVAWRLHDPNYRIPQEDHYVKPGSVFRPMLCSRNTRDLADIVKAMGKGRTKRNDGQDETLLSRNNEFYYTVEEFIVEEKLDGERIQLHKMGDTYQYNSRKSHDYTYLYGKDKSCGSMTPFIDHLFPPEIEEIILDGEMLVYDPNIDRYIPFGTLKSFAHLDKFSRTEPRPCFKVFDVLYIKLRGQSAKSFLKTPLCQRKKALSQVFEPAKGIIEVATVEKASTTEHLRAILTRILETKGEGIVVKNPESLYILGGREDTWVKVKPDYMDELGETIDAVVIGGYWGQGGRGGMHSSFLVGLRDDTVPEIDGEPVFKSFAKFGTGFSAENFRWVQEHTKDKWLQCSKAKKNLLPRWFVTVSEYPDQLIAPSNSFVVTIKAAELVGGAEYGAGTTLRFPRAMKIREDMDATTSMNLETMRELKGKAGTKRSVGEDLSTKHKKTKTNTGRSHYVSAPTGKIELNSLLFRGFTFYVAQVAPDSRSDKPKLETLIQQHGGAVMQKIPSTEKSIIIASKILAKLKAVKDWEKLDVIRPEWVLNSIERGRRLALRECFYTQASDQTKHSEAYNQEEDDPDNDDEEKDYKGDVKMEDVPSDIEDIPDESFRGVNNNDSDGEITTEDEYDHRGPAEVSDESGDEGDDAMPPPSDEGVTDLAKAGIDPMALSDAEPGMGAGQGAVDFDPAVPFKHFVAYFDTGASALLNGLPASQASEKAQKMATKQLKDALSEFEENGGVATSDLDDPRLTHIVVHKSVEQTPYSTLLGRTSKPRYRRIVTPDWIYDTITHDVLANEADYVPSY